MKINNFSKIKGPQKELKAMAVELLENNGFNVEGYEIWIRGGIVDILAKKENQQIAMECGPCRIDKAIDYLEIPNTELWILPRQEISKNVTIFKIIKGENWDWVLNRKKKYVLEETRKMVQEAFSKTKWE